MHIFLNGFSPTAGFLSAEKETPIRSERGFDSFCPDEIHYKKSAPDMAFIGHEIASRKLYRHL